MARCKQNMGEVVNLTDHSAARLGRHSQPGARQRSGAGRQPGARPQLRSGKPVFFDRRELHLILDLYARMVATGEWRDYALAYDGSSCSFAIFRRSTDTPLFRIVKQAKARGAQRAYAIQATGGLVLRRGASLANALKMFERQRLALV